RIRAHVVPLFGVALLLPQAMMPAPRLKPPLRTAMRLSAQPLPVRDPLLDGESLIGGAAEAMQMIRHQQKISHQPAFRLRPCVRYGGESIGMGQPRSMRFRADR